MSEPTQTPSKPAAMRGTASDERVLAQVEKWMATIREMSREQPAQPKLHA
jgi:hypothetical protein